MRRNWIVDGDTTDHGGTVYVPECMIKIDGKNVASLGDDVRCPKCNVTRFFVEGSAKASVKGAAIAEAGCLTSYGARLTSIKQTRSASGVGFGRSTSSVDMTELTSSPAVENICEACLDEAAARGTGLVSAS